MSAPLSKHKTEKRLQPNPTTKSCASLRQGMCGISLGGHLAHYVDSTNSHLRRTLLHPDVQRRGGTRLEISLYACDTEDLSQIVAEELIAEALELANTEEGLFVVQPPAKQSGNLAQRLDRCMLLGDRPQGAIYLAWSGHSKTGRVQGMLVKPTAATFADDAS